MKLHLFCISSATVFFLNVLYNHTHLHLCVSCLTIVTRLLCVKDTQISVYVLCIVPHSMFINLFIYKSFYNRIRIRHLLWGVAIYLLLKRKKNQRLWLVYHVTLIRELHYSKYIFNTCVNTMSGWMWLIVVLYLSHHFLHLVLSSSCICMSVVYFPLM